MSEVDQRKLNDGVLFVRDNGLSRDVRNGTADRRSVVLLGLRKRASQVIARIYASSPDVGAKAANRNADAGGSGFPPAAHHTRQGSTAGDTRKPKSNLSNKIGYAAEVALLFAVACFLEGVRLLDELWSGR